MSKLYLIIGGGGFIGRHLMHQLVASGTQLRVLDIIARPDHTPDSVEWHRGSILDEDVLSNAMQGVDTVFHLAALAHLGVPQTRRPANGPLRTDKYDWYRKCYKGCEDA